MYIRQAAVIGCSLFASACAIFPRTVPEAVVTINDVKDSIDCEVASVLIDSSLDFNKADFRKWNVVADLDLTLVRSLAADGKVSLGAPYTIAQVTATPSLGISRVDTSIAHVEFGSTAGEAAARLKSGCVGPDPSQTQMGLAAWLAANLTSMRNGDVSGITYTKQFQVVANVGARFGYNLVPVTNTVALDAGAGGAYDQTHRLTVAIAPPSPPPKPIPVYKATPKTPAQTSSPKGPVRVDRSTGAADTREGSRAARDPTIQYLLGRKSPVTFSR